MGGSGHRRRVGPTDEWEQIELLCRRLARAEGLRAHPPPGAVRRFGGREIPAHSRGLRADPPAAGEALRRGGHGEPLRLRAREPQEAAARQRRPTGAQAEHPALNPNEIANIVRAGFGRKPDVRSVRRVLDEEPMPLR